MGVIAAAKPGDTLIVILKERVLCATEGPLRPRPSPQARLGILSSMPFPAKGEAVLPPRIVRTGIHKPSVTSNLVLRARVVA